MSTTSQSPFSLWISRLTIRRFIAFLFLFLAAISGAVAIDQLTYQSLYESSNSDPHRRIKDLAPHISFLGQDDLKDCGFHRFYYHSCGMCYSPFMVEFRGWADLNNSAAESLKLKYEWKPFPDKNLQEFRFGDYYLPKGPALYAVIKDEHSFYGDYEIIFIEEDRGWNYVQYCSRHHL